MKKDTIKTEKQRENTKNEQKGFEKKRLLTISNVNFEGKGEKIAKTKK